MNLQRALSPIFQRASAEAVINSGGFFNFFGGTLTKNGTVVNQDSALTLSAFFNAVDIISNDYAKLPKAVFQKTNTDRIKQNNHPLQYLISTRPNQYMTSFMFDKMIITHAILKGNGYAIIERHPNTAAPVALQLINQDQTPVSVIKYDNGLFYKIGDTLIAAEDIYHIPGFSLNGITGISVISYAAISLGTALSSQEFGSDYYKAKGVGTAVVTSSKSIDADGKIRLGDALNTRLNQAGNWKTVILDETGSFQHLNITPQESQFLVTNKYAIAEVARWLNIPVHKLKDNSDTNNSISESQELMYAADSIVPWAIKNEQEANCKLFTVAEQKAGFHIKANIGSLLRSDKKTQSEFFSKLIFSGVYTRNEVRNLLDMNSIDGLDEPLTPVNAQTMAQIDAKLKELETKIQA